MAVLLLGYRLRGDWLGIFISMFIICCWTFAFYCSVFTVIHPYFADYPDYQNTLLVGYITISLLTIASMLQCIFSNPGKLLDVGNAEFLGWEYCELCQKHRPPRSHHCRRCSQCVRKMDHHCPWINNCVGEDNNRHFIQFLFYTSMMGWFSLSMCISYFMDWLPKCNACQQEAMALDIKIEVTCLTFLSLLFGAFTSFMFLNQMILIVVDVTSLEMMKDRSSMRRNFFNSRKPSLFTLLSRTFGSSNICTWIIPCKLTPVRPSYEYDTYSWNCV